MYRLWRTDKSFENMIDKNCHHEQPRPFHGSSVGMVSQFSLRYMHLVCLGVVRRKLHFWLRGHLNFQVPANIAERMSAKVLQNMFLYSCGVCLKAQIAKGIRLLEGHWMKAVSAVHSNCNVGTFLDRNMYSNFMLLFSGIAILVSTRLSCHTQYATTLLRSFVSHFGEIYGKDQIVY